jgi:hypothetical protein
MITSARRRSLTLLMLSGLVVFARPAAGRTWSDVTDGAGLGGISSSRVMLIDLDRDGCSDAVVDRHRIFMNQPDESSPIGRRFVELPTDEAGLQPLHRGDICVFADLDNDGHLDALVTRYLDLNNEKWEDHGLRTAWQPGRGDGSFGEPRPIEVATPATTSAVAVGDFNRDGRLDVYLGGWYEQYGGSYAGDANELLLQTDEGWERLAPLDRGLWVHDEDSAGRPTYGVAMAHLDPLAAARRPLLFDLNYGRRWNRLWMWLADEGRFLDVAPLVGFDGDDIRHGRHPDWLKERARTDPRFDRADEPPFRANGNTFDIAFGDIDNDGDFDLFLAEITHGWAGESSDRSRLLITEFRKPRGFSFHVDEAFNVDRVPEDRPSWNQGDLFAELLDVDNDGWVDLLLSSGDYPDDQRLRLYRNEAGDRFDDWTERLGLDHDGSQQLGIGDVDGDGRLDVLVGQTFFRYSAEQKAGRTPQIRLFQSRIAPDNRSLVLRLQGDPSAGINRDAIGATVGIRIGDDWRYQQLAPIGGHSGKQRDLLVHFGLGEHEQVDELVVRWPGAVEPTVATDLAAGRYVIQQGAEPCLMDE